MTIVVTGAAGHAGANLVRALLAQGRPTRALVHVDQQAVKGLDVEVIEGDIRDLQSLVDAFEGAEVVYHLAAHISLLKDEWPLLESINVIGTRNVVEACLCCGVRRLVHFSSIHTMTQAPMGIPVDELRPLVASQHCSPYNRSKAVAEKEVHKGIEKGLDAIIISPTAIIGPYDYRPSHFGEAYWMTCADTYVSFFQLSQFGISDERCLPYAYGQSNPPESNVDAQRIQDILRAVLRIPHQR